MVLLQVCKKKFKVCAQFIQDKFIAFTTLTGSYTLGDSLLYKLSPKVYEPIRGLISLTQM